MRLRYAPDVQAFVSVLAPAVKKAVREATDLLRKDPFHPKLEVKALRKVGGERLLRARVARDYRIMYSTRPDHTYVWRILHRSEGYDWLERLDP